MSRVAVTTEDGRYDGGFEWDKAGRWSDRDVNGNGSGGAGRGEAVMLTAGGRWVLERWTNWQGRRNAYQWITAEEAQAWLMLNREHEAVAEYFGEQPEEEDKRAGRPEIGGYLGVRLGELHPAVARWAEQDGVKMAEWVRQAVEEKIARRAGSEIGAAESLR